MPATNSTLSFLRLAALATACLLLQAHAPALAQGTAPSTTATVSPEPKPPEPVSPQVLSAWRGKVMAHLNTNIQKSNAAGSGTSTVAFSIDRGGRVLSATVVKSSGSATLDQEAVALTKRSSPVPPPPSALTGNKLYLKVPIHFVR